MSVAAHVGAQLARIDALNDAHRAFVTVDAAGARAAAEAADRATARGLLHGVTVAVKDNIDTEGLRTACGSLLFADRIPDADATVVRRLRAAGAIVLGKAALMELCFGVRSTDMIGGQVRNPWNTAHVPGGSSGGSAAAVALDLCDAALGTDTGGSVRVPAAFCGVTGLRPTHGRVSNRGVLPVSASFDTVGPLARDVETVARMFVAMAGFDPEDPGSARMALDAELLTGSADMAGVRIGVPRNFYHEDIDPEIAAAVRAFAHALADAGADLVPVDVRGAEVAHQFSTTIILADACELHARALDETPGKFSPQVFQRMIKGRARSAVDYAAAMRFREAWRRDLATLFRTVDLLLYPSTPHPAPPIQDNEHLEDATRHATRFSYGGGLAGLPGLSLPCGITSAGLPIGALLEAAWCNEAVLLRAGRAWQRATDWHLRRPRVG